VKDLHTHRVVALLEQDAFFEWGTYSWLWGGRWFTPDGGSYLLYPQNPEGDTKAWEKWQDADDPVRSGDMGRAGWVYIEARFNPLDTTEDPELMVAENADDATRAHVHVILGPKAVSVGASLYVSQPVYALRATTAYEGRYDVYTDEWPGLGRGIRLTLGHLYEDVAYRIAGWELFIVNFIKQVEYFIYA